MLGIGDARESFSHYIHTCTHTLTFTWGSPQWLIARIRTVEPWRRWWSLQRVWEEARGWWLLSIAFHCSSVVWMKACHNQFSLHCPVSDDLTPSALFCTVSSSWPREDCAIPLSKFIYRISEFRSNRTEHCKRKYESN